MLTDREAFYEKLHRRKNGKSLRELLSDAHHIANDAALNLGKQGFLEKTLDDLGDRLRRPTKIPAGAYMGDQHLDV